MKGKRIYLITATAQKPRVSIWVPLMVLFVFLFFSIRTVTAQDIHFSQFNSAPMNMNPALAGQFDGDYRFIGNQRMQWRSVTLPYSTFGISADARNFLGKENVGAGLSVYRDITGDSRFQTLQVNLAGTYLMPVSSDSLHSISFGIQPGLTYRSIDYTDLEFDNQYDGFGYDPSLAHGESFLREKRTYMNLNAGIGYYYQPEKRKMISGGLSFYNLTKPKQSFFNVDDITLDVRTNVHVAGQWPVADDWDVLPSIQFMSQGTFKEIIFGGSAKYILMDERGAYRAVYFGGWYRNKDAGFISVGMDYDSWNVGVSYDINVSNLTPASNMKGGLEISVIYILRQFKPNRIQHRICPDYI